MLQDEENCQVFVRVVTKNSLLVSGNCSTSVKREFYYVSKITNTMTASHESESFLPRREYHGIDPTHTATGDFAHLPNPVKALLVDNALKGYYAAHDYALNSDNGIREAALRRQMAVATEVERLQSEVDGYREFVATRYPEETRLDIVRKYQEADASTNGATPEKRAQARLGQFEGVVVVTDMDKTLTETDSYLPQLLASRHAEEQLKGPRGRDAFGEVFVRTWQEALKVDPVSFTEVGKEAPLRKGVKEFFAKSKESKVPITILSANFMPFVEGVLDQIPHAKGSEVWAVTKDSIVATDKGTVVKHTALENPGKSVIFIGDGASDLPALEAADMIGVYFALEGSVFASELQKKGLTHFTYKSFEDVNSKLEELGVLEPTFPQQAE